MSDRIGYGVQPREAQPRPIPTADSMPLTDSETASVEGVTEEWGCGALALGTVLVGAMTGSALFGVLAGPFLVLFLHLALKTNGIVSGEQLKAARARSEAEFANAWDIEQSQREADALTSNLATVYTSSSAHVVALPEHVRQASAWLRQAELEYGDSAFGPFWDAVENATRQLSAFNDKTVLLSKSATVYYRELSGRNHDFPVFPLPNGVVPECSLVLSQLSRVVRLGQTNFQFANIWEHRRTREVMISGFRTLGEAVRQLESTVEVSLSGLQESVSSATATLVEEQIKTRESIDARMKEQSRMLDNIQRRRKPESTEPGPEL